MNKQVLRWLSLHLYVYLNIKRETCKDVTLNGLSFVWGLAVCLGGGLSHPNPMPGYVHGLSVN